VEPVTLIVGALAAGAIMGLGESASVGVKDAYAALKAMVRARIDNQAAVVVLEQFEHDPDIYEKSLAAVVLKAGIDQDPRIVQLAQNLLELMDPDGSDRGKYEVTLHGQVQGVQVGDSNTQTNTFGQGGPVGGSPPGPDFDD
jgi:hypothetical protein